MSQLQRKLRPRHVQMIALGGAIGAGIFQGSAETIQSAGPGVLIAYLIAGVLLFIVMGSLAEMALANKGLDIRGLIYKALGYQVSFVVGWIYFIMWILVMAVEIVAAGTFLHYWFTGLPVWLLSFLVALVLVGLNLLSVGLFGEVEFWLTGIKVFTLMAFVILGSGLMFGWIPTENPPYLTHLTAHGGFLPLGWKGVISSLLIVIFSYGGTEMIGLTITEMKDPEKSLPKVIKDIIIRICLFYVLPLFIIMGLVPWNQVGEAGSPFVTVFSALELKGVAHIMNFILLIAVTSAANTGIYSSSRVLYSLSKQKEAPAIFSRLNKNGVPIYSLILCAGSLLLGSVVAMAAEESVFQYLMGIPGYTTIMLWIIICLSQLKLRKQYKEKPFFQIPLYPYLTGFTLAVLSVIFITLLLNPDNIINSLVFLSMMIVLFCAARFKSGLADQPLPDSSS
ncbi:amino acid permease [Thermoactinomyces intermedius]|jgi:amino acid transporter, AAT family|uniref:Amino acid permease n=3 Tax=Thermoactinomyces intermedius TaxID=2024 RepID=A0A8I1A7Q0_THEIN|nr:amino acid permease [Thermoactinomyces intermedius]MBA4547539.1 amino acid permease [Thermoactinomyces intermedius]MBH8594231.1 amino acid permease [Thermoactinomyces intermedius]